MKRSDGGGAEGAYIRCVSGRWNRIEGLNSTHCLVGRLGPTLDSMLGWSMGLGKFFFGGWIGGDGWSEEEKRSILSSPPPVLTKDEEEERRGRSRRRIHPVRYRESFFY